MERVAYRTCPLCEATCGLEIEVVDGKVKRIRGDRANPFSAGFICPKGSTLKQLHEDPDRLRHPLIREPEGHRRASWEEAFALVAERWEQVTGQYGRQAVAIYVGNPNVHQLDNTVGVRGLIRSLGTKNIFTASTVDQMPKHVAAGLMFGHPLNIPVPDLDRTNYLLMLGANPYESNGSLCTAPDFPGRMEKIRARGGKVVVVDPRRTKSAANADRWIPIRPGTDAALLLALANVIVTAGLARDQVAAGKAEPWVAPFLPEAVAGFTGVEAGQIRDLAIELATAPTAAVYGRIGTHTVTFGTLAAWAVDLLNILTGNLDRPGGAMFPYAAHLPARRKSRPFQTGRWHSRVRQWGEVLGEFPVATMADEIETEGEGQVRFLITVAGNPVLTTPDSARLDAALAQLDFMVSVDPYLNETSRRADVVLPPPSALERSHYDLAFTGLSVRDYSAYSSPVFETGAMTEFEILVRLTGIALGMGAEADPDQLAEMALMGEIQKAVSDPESTIAGRDPGEIMALVSAGPWPERFLDLMLRTGHRGDGFGANPEGLTLEVLKSQPHGIDFGPLEPRLEQLLTTSSGEIDLVPEPIVGDLPRLLEAVETSTSSDLVLIGRRQLRSANSWLHNVEVLMKGRERCTLLINPDDAVRLGLADGGRATVSSNVGKVEIIAEVTSDIAPGVVSIPYGWGHDQAGVQLSVAAAHPGVNTNLLTDSQAIDPLSGNAVLNGIPVTVAPSSGP
ncbi:MAG TPA: molybdopterin-dependent oxidoreductase [Acidimicrobiia bacterium]|nr:molybdopterin-dependent oxidoreductase [Acidimicrobiia bacterium]